MEQCSSERRPVAKMSRTSQEPLHSARARNQSPDRRRSGQFSLEELSDDDIGYDADVEVVRPEYEDVESGNDDDAHEQDESSDSANLEDQLSHRLKGLYCDPGTVSSDTQRTHRKGKKRMSKDMEGIEGSMGDGRSEIEIMELSVHTDDRQPAKRQRKRADRSKTGERIVRLISEDRVGSLLRSDVEASHLASSSSSIEQSPTLGAQDIDMTMTDAL